MERTVIVPGSFDPVTLGHVDIIARAARLFDRVWAVVMINEEKQYLLPLEKRRALLADAVCSIPGVCVDEWPGMLYEYAVFRNACAVVKGVQDQNDLLYEMRMADYNDRKCRAQTVLLPATEKLKDLSSSLVKARLSAGEDISALVTPLVLQEMEKVYLTNNAKRKGNGDTHGGKCD